MMATQPTIESVEELRQYIHKVLCDKENLLADQFQMREHSLILRGKPCGIQFSLRGPRSIRLGAIWTQHQNTVYFYDTQGERFLKIQLPHSLATEVPAA